MSEEVNADLINAILDFNKYELDKYTLELKSASLITKIKENIDKEMTYLGFESSDYYAEINKRKECTYLIITFKNCIEFELDTLHYLNKCIPRNGTIYFNRQKVICDSNRKQLPIRNIVRIEWAI